MRLPGGTAGWVLYDASCGICTRWVPFWEPALRRLGLAIAPLQDSQLALRTGIPAVELLDDLRLLHADGSVTSGAEVYRYVMKRLWWARPMYLLSVAPVGRLIFDWVYRTFADHRQAISRGCGLPAATP